MVPHVEFIRVENHVVRCLRVERFLDFRVRRHADVDKDEEEEKEVEEFVQRGGVKEFSPHFCAFKRANARREKQTFDGFFCTFKTLLYEKNPKSYTRDRHHRKPFHRHRRSEERREEEEARRRKKKKKKKKKKELLRLLRLLRR